MGDFVACKYKTPTIEAVGDAMCIYKQQITGANIQLLYQGMSMLAVIILSYNDWYEAVSRNMLIPIHHLTSLCLNVWFHSVN